MVIRMRDRRKDEAARRKYRETAELSVKDLVMPIFVKEGLSGRKEIKSMPGIYQLSLKESVKEAKKIFSAGIPGVIIFGIPKEKDDTGSCAYAQDGIVQQAIAAIKKKIARLNVIADVCLCEYTSHGHCGVIKQSQVTGPATKPLAGRHKSQKEFTVDNDETIKILAKVAVSYAKAGADVVAPSAMMDGQVKAIKMALIINKFPKVKILAYSAKYASAFYGPFRDAAESPPQFGDRSTYQMDFHNTDEALLEAKLDIKEGADMLMVKPALGYQDIIYRIKKAFKYPLACYSVSGEYSMIKSAALSGHIDEKKVVLESLTGFKRAGANIIITYYAKEASKWLKSN